MNILVLGGSSSGKSHFALDLAKKLVNKKSSLYFIATMNPIDEEDQKRIHLHQEERIGYAFQTIESPYLEFDRTFENGVVLLDSFTAYLTNALYGEQAKTSLLEIMPLLHSLKAQDLIVVSDYLFLDALHFADETNLFRKILGQYHQEIGTNFDSVIVVRNGVITLWKGEIHHECFSWILNSDQYVYDCSSEIRSME